MFVMLIHMAMTGNTRTILDRQNPSLTTEKLYHLWRLSIEYRIRVGLRDHLLERPEVELMGLLNYQWQQGQQHLVAIESQHGGSGGGSGKVDLMNASGNLACLLDVVIERVGNSFSLGKTHESLFIKPILVADDHPIQPLLDILGVSIGGRDRQES